MLKIRTWNPPKKGPTFSELRPFCLTSTTEASAFSLNIATASRAQLDSGEAASKTFQVLFEILQRVGEVGYDVSKAISAITDLVDRARTDKGVLSIPVRITNIVRGFGVEGDYGGVFGSVSSFAIEVGLVRGKRVYAEDLRLFKFDRTKVELATEQRRTRVASGVFPVLERALHAEHPEFIRGYNQEQIEPIRVALKWVKLVQDALAAFRAGNIKALEYEGRVLAKACGRHAQCSL